MLVAQMQQHEPFKEYSEKDFVKKISFIVMLLGGQSDLLSLLGSWRGTLSDEEVLEGLDLWIKEKTEEQKQVILHVETWHKIS